MKCEEIRGVGVKLRRASIAAVLGSTARFPVRSAAWPKEPQRVAGVSIAAPEAQAQKPEFRCHARREGNKAITNRAPDVADFVITESHTASIA